MADNRYYYFKDAKGNRHTVDKTAYDKDPMGFAKAFPGARMEVIDRKTGRRGDVSVKDASRVGDFGAHLFTGRTITRGKGNPNSSALGRAQQSVAQEKWGGGVVTQGNTTAYESASAPMENDSELVRGLKNANAVQRLQAPVSYTKPGAVKQMVGRAHGEQQMLDRRIEKAGREAGKDVQGEIRRRNAPAFDLGNENVNNNLVKTRGQLEDELEESSRQLVDKQLGGYINNSIQKMFKDATVKGAAAEDALSKASPFAYMAAGKAYNEALDPDKLMNQLSKNAEKDMAGLFSDPKMQKEIAEKAASLGIDPEDYVKNYIAPGLQTKIAEEFEKSELSRSLPKSTAEYILRGLTESSIGTILSMGMTSKKQRQYAQQGMAMTDNGENPYVKPGMGARVARGFLSFAADGPMFGVLGKAGAAVAGKVMGNGVAQAARIANTSLGGRIGRMAAAGIVSQGVTGVLYGSTNAAVQNYSTGDDTSIGNTVKLMIMGGLSEGASWATMGGIGGAVGAGIYNVSGVKRIPAKVFQLAMEGVGMHMGGNVAKMIEGHDTDWLSVEGNLEACANVVALKLTHARLPKRYTKDGKKESYLDMVARNIKNLMTSDGQRAAFGGYTFTNEEKEQLFGSDKAPKREETLYGYDVHDNPLTREESLTSWAMRAKKTAAKGKGEESYKDTDAEFVKTAYDEIMADNTIPWDTKAKFSALVMGTVPSARPMMDHIAIERDERGAYVGEYSLYGELLSKNRYKTADEYVSIKYNLVAKKENQRLSNAYGAAQIKDEKAAQETLETVAETFGFTAEQMKAAIDKDPLKRSEEEQNACVALRKAYEGEQFPEGTLHPDQSQTEGKDVVEENNLGTENPNNEAVAEVLNNMNNAEKAFNAALESNDVLKQEYERLTKEGLSEPQIYMELINSGLTQEQLAPFADYINAKAKAVGMYRGTEQKIVETVQKHVEQWSYKGELNGEKQDGGQMLFVKDNNGRLLIVGAGDVAFDSEGRARESVGDMLSVLDPNTKEMDFVSKKDVQLDHVEKTEDYAKNYQTMLEEKNSTAYAESEKGKEKSEKSEGGSEELRVKSEESNGDGGDKPGEQPEVQRKVAEDYEVAKALKEKIGGSLSEEDAANLVGEMESRAKEAHDMPLTPENWEAEFGEDGKVQTPLGEVKMGENQLVKLFERGRSKEFGMIKPTLSDPDVVIEVPSESKDGKAERDTSLLFIKTFKKPNGEKVYYFKSVTIKKDGIEISISSHYDRKKRVEEALENGKLLYLKQGDAQTEQSQLPVSGTTFREIIAGLNDKDSNNSANGNGNNETLTFADGSHVPMMKDTKGRETADYSQMTPEQGAEWMSSQFGENAEAAVDGQIKRAEKMLNEAEKIKVDYTGDLNDAKEAEAQKTKAVDAAKAELELYTNIKKVMTANKVKAGMEKVGAVGEEGSVSEAGNLGAVREKFESGKRIVGNKRTRTLADGSKLRGHYEIVEADSLTPSHNANDGYKKSEGFPVNEEGRTINDRDYENDKQAQLVTDMIAMKYDGQAVDQVPVVTADGIVVDGNGRTMAGQKAAKNGTDGAYLEALKENAENYGFTAEQIEQSGIKHPRLVLVSDEPMKYDTATFAKFNKNEKKTQGNTQQAVAQSKKLSADEISTIVAEIEGSGSLDAFFNNPTAINSLLKRLVDKGVIGLNEVAGLREGEDKLSAAGKDFVKNLLLGSVFSEDTIRMMGADAGLKSKALNGIRAVLDNMKLGDYALMNEIDHAMQLMYEAHQDGSGVDAYLRTPAMFGENAANRYDPISQAIALALEGKVEDFRELMMAYNRNAAHYADASQAEMFGEKPTKEEFVKEFLKFRNWKNYETRHSSKEGNGDVGGTEGTEPQARGGSDPRGSEERRVKSEKSDSKVEGVVTPKGDIKDATAPKGEEPLAILPKKEEKAFDPIGKAAENYKKDHPLTEEEIRSSDVDDIAKDMAVDYLNGEVTDDLHRAVYESIYEKVKDAKMKNATKQADNKTETTETPKVEASASPIEEIKNAAEKFAKEKEAAAEAMGEVNKPQQKADDAAVEASNKKVNDLWNDLLKAGREDLSASFIGLNARQLEVLPKLVSAMAENAYLRIKRGMHNLEDVVKEMRKEFAPAAQVFKKEDVDAIYEQMMNIRYRDGEQRMSLKEWADYYEKSSPKHKEELVGDSKEAEDRKLREKRFVDKVNIQLGFGHKFNGIVELRKMAEKCGLKDVKDTDLQELAETAIVQRARGIASSESYNDARKFELIKKLYENQPSLNQRDSERVMKQQYSTPAPYAFLADMYLKAGIEVKSALEPSAGNGMLTIGLPKDAVHVNDIDAQRLANLQKQGFKNVTSQDGTQPFADKDVDVVVTNPPFGSATPRDYDGYTISSLEGQMAINALESMKDNGRAAIIIGGKTEYAKNGSLNPKDKALLGYLYSHYNVEDVINVDGSLYAKQGTTYPTRIILINGRRFDENAYPPVKDKARAEAVKSYDELYKRINDDILRSGRMGSPVGERGEDANAKPNRPSVADANEEGVRAGGNGGGEQKPSVRTGGVHDKTAEPVSDNVLGTEGGTKPGENGGLPDGAAGANGAGTEPASSKEPTTGTNKQRGNESGGNRRPNTQSNADETTDAGNGGGSRGQLERLDRPVRELSSEKVAYTPRSENPFTLKAVMPADQQESVNKNLEKLGDADQFLVDELGYNDKADLYAHLAAEQVDSVALALQQAKKGNAFIIGDMTGIGKGRQAASLIRYAKKQGQVPVYFTKTAGLLSDVYRDLVDIGSKELRPFVFGSAKEAAITDADGNVVFALPSKSEVKRVLDYIEKNGELPKEYDYVLTTYSQVSNGVYEFDENGNRKERKLAKGKKFGAAAISGQARRDAIEKLMKNGYLILDESHTAGGDSGQGNYFQHIIQKAKNVTFFSATFAKRPDNMPIYALRTAMNQGGLKASDLIDAVKRGGATLQEIMSQALTQCGQMIRRERDMTGVTIDWKAIDDPEVVAEQREQYDSIIGLFNDIINFQRTYVSAYVDRRNEELAEVQSSMGIKRGTESLGIKNQPFASKAFNTVQQVLLSLKAKSAAERAIDYLKQGMKPVIALNNTNESQTGNLALGEEMDAPDLGTSLKKGLEGTLRYTSKNAKDESESGYINLSDLGADAVEAYHALEEKIRKTSTGLSLSPIDVIKNELTKAGYKVGELTGRQTEFVYNENGTVTKVKRADTDKKKLAREFNDGQIDALILNKSAATGISLHASSKYADQRKRVMIVAQQQLDVNDEVQMRGRIDRTGQVARGAYEYVVSLIPAEQRLLMMFKAKLKSLDANTTSSQKSKFNEMEVADITNKYGDKVVKEYMAEHLDLYARMADPFGWEKSYGADLSTIDPQKLVSSSDGMNSEAGGDASKLLGRMALLKVKEQEKMLQEIGDLYAAEIQRLNEMGENDLEITELPLKAKTINKGVWKEGSEPGGDNAFSDNTYVEKVNMAVLKKPMKAEEVKKAQDGLTGGKSWDEYKKEKKKAIEDYFINKAKEEGAKIEERARKAAAKAREKYLKDALRNQKNSGMTDEQIAQMAIYQQDNIYKVENEKSEEVVKNLKAKAEMFYRILETFNTEDAFVLPTDMNNPAELSGFGNSYGRLIDIKITDNFSPNASTISFATLDGRRKITFPINGKVGLGNDKADVIGIIDRLTRQASAMGDKHLRVLSMDASNWDKLTSNESRKDGYIITGNLLQALIDTKEQGLGGQLVKYTTDTGEVKTGILMPEKFEPNGLANEKPINSVAEKFELPSNKGGITEVTSSDGDVKIEQGFDYIKMTRNYTIRVPKSNKKGGKYFLDKELLKMVDGGNFETRGNTMFAEVKEEKLKDVLDRLSELGVKVKEESKVHYRMELGNTFSDSKEHFDAVRDRAVEEKGIVMPNLNKEKVKVVEVEKHSFKGENEGAIENARAWAKENLVTTNKQDLPTMRDGTPYTISKKAVDKYLSSSAVSKSDELGVHLSVLPKLTDVIHESIEAEIHADYNVKDETGKRKAELGYGNNILVHRLYGAVEMDGKIYRVKTTMQEFRGGEENKPHSYEVTKIELLDSPGKRENPDRPHSDASNNSIDNKIELPDTPGTAVLPDSSPLDMTPSNSIDTAKLLQGVEKSYDSGKKLLDESKDLTDGETFFRKEGNGVVTPEKTSGTSNAVSERIIKTVEKVAKRTGGKVKMVNSVEEIENPKVRKDIENGKQVTGWYDEKTGEVHLYMPNIHDTYTAEKTVWHETVGHKGMRGLLGDKFNDYMRSLWMDLDNPINAELRAYVKEKMNMNHLGFYDAIEEFIAKSAEDGKGEPGFWNYIKNKVTDALHEIGYRVSPNVKDVKYMLWLAKNVQKHGDSPLWKMRAEAVKWKIEHEKTEYTKIEGGELYDNDGKNHDFESMSREEWLEATDGEIHYRTAPNAATALDRYHHALDRHSYMATEAFMDNMLSLKKLMEAIDPSIKKIEDVNSSMNPYLMQNITEGKMSDKSKLFEIRYMDPLSKAMSSVLGSFDGKKVEDRIRNFNLYMIRKHGLERNRVLFVRDKIREERKVKSEESDSIDALETAWKDERSDLRQKLETGQIDLKEYYRQMDEWIVQNLDKDFKAEEHDYSGMHGLQGIDDMKSPYDDAGAIDEVMSQEASMEGMKQGSVADFWKKVKAATDYSVNSDYESGLISKNTHDGVLGMFDWYVPLRKFDEATAEDVYGYVTEMGDPSNYIGTTLMNAKGRKSLSNVEILAQIGLMGNRAIRNGGQNMIKQAFARFVRNSGEQNLVKETKVWVKKTGTDLNGNDIWEEAYPKIPEEASADDVATIVDAFETDMRTKQAKGEAKSLSSGTDIGFKFQRAKDKSQHFVDVKIAGRTHRFVVLGNPRAAQALNGMLENGKASQKWLQTVTRWMAMASTSWSPEFVMRNIVRDMEFASSHVAAKEGGRYLAKWSRYYGELNPLNMFYNDGAGSLKSMKMKDFKNGVGYGLYARYREGTLGNSKMERYFKEFMENGGETGFVQLFSMHDMEKSYKSIVEKESAKGAKKVMVNAVEVLKKLGKNVENLNEVAENMARFATYCTSRDLGRSAARSAYDAKEVSTNFNRHGSGDAIKSFKNGEMGDWQKARRNTYGFVAGYLRNYSMFFNAGIQSTNLLFKNIKRAPVGTTVAMTSAPFALALIMAAVNNAIIQNEDDKDRGNVKDPYGELPDYIRRNNLCIYVGKNRFVTVPLAIELRAFYSLGDLAAGQTFAKNVKSQRNMAMDAVGCMSQLFPVMDFLNNPNYEKSLENGVGMTTEGIAPTAIVPFIEWWLNNDWKGAPIRRTGDKTELNPAWQNAYNNVPARLVDLNKWVNAKTNNIAPGNPEMKGNDALDWITDPSMLNHFYSSWSGGMGTFVQRTAGLGAKVATGKTDEIEVGDVPFLRSLFYTPREQSSMARTKAKWYNYKEEMEQTIANNDKLKSKNVPTMKRIENAAALEKFEGSAEQRKVNIIKNAEKRMRHWNTMRKKWADDKKQVDFANKNIEMIMQEAVEDLDKIE